MSKNLKETTVDEMIIEDQLIENVSDPEEFPEPSMEPDPTEEISKDAIISLARANKLRNDLEKELESTADKILAASNKQITIYPTYELTDLEAKIQESKKHVAILSVHYGYTASILKSLKNTIAGENFQSGITEIMSEIARVKNLRSLYSELYGVLSKEFPWSSLKVRDPKETNYLLRQVKLQDINAQTSSVISGSPVLPKIPLYTQEEIENEQRGVANLRKNLMELEEKRNELNYKNTITIKAEAADWLKSHQLL